VQLVNPVLRSSIQSVLWPAYMLLLSWLFVPVYTAALSAILPLTTDGVDQILMLSWLSVGPVAFWSGIRGGPLWMSESAVLFDIVAGQRNGVLMAAVLRQGLLTGGVAGVVGVSLSVMGAGGEVDWSVSIRHSIIGLSCGVLVTSLAVLWNTEGRWRTVDRGLAAAASVPPLATAVIGSDQQAIMQVSLISAFGGLVLAMGRSSAIPVSILWARSRHTSNLQISASLVDVPSVIADLRSARDGVRIHRTLHGMVDHLPLPVWRVARSFAGAPVGMLIRVAVVPLMLAAGLVLITEPNSQFVVVAVLLFLAATDLASPMASVVVTPELNRGTPVNTSIMMPVMTAVSILAVLALAMTGWLLAGASGVQTATPELSRWIPLVLGVAVAATFQARLSSIDAAELAVKILPDLVGVVLALRGLAGFVVVLSSVVALAPIVATVDPQLLRNIWVVLLTLAVLVTARPLDSRK